MRFIKMLTRDVDHRAIHLAMVPTCARSSIAAFTDETPENIFKGAPVMPMLDRVELERIGTLFICGATRLISPA
jgi:hypothetical protein